MFSAKDLVDRLRFNLKEGLGSELADVCFQKASTNNEFIQASTSRKPKSASFSTVFLSYSVWEVNWLLTEQTEGPLWVANPRTDWGVNNCIVLACYSCCSPPACLVCPSERQMTHRSTQRCWRRNVSERCPVQQPGSCESTWHGHSCGSPIESHFVWLALPWWRGVFGNMTKECF